MPNFIDEDLVCYQDNETENFNSDPDSDDQRGENLINEMDETNMIRNLQKKLNENFDLLAILEGVKILTCHKPTL